MAHVNLDPTSFERRPGLLVRLLLAASRRVTGEDLDTVAAMAHRPGVLLPWTLLEAATMRTRSVLPDRLADLVVFVVARRLGCPWCVDYSAALWQRRGLAPGLLHAAAQWRSHPELFDQTARAAFAFAEAATTQPIAPTDELAVELRRLVGEAGLVEVAYWAALENMRSRFNASLGLASQGFSETCAVPASSLPTLRDAGPRHEHA